MLELKHLKALQALYQYGTFSQAASELCVTTSALSHQIAALEGWLDVELISRKTRPFQFTKQGLLLLDLANQVLPMVDQTLIRMQDKKQKIKHKLFVASECHCCFDWLIHVMNAYHDSFPETDLDFITAVLVKPQWTHSLYNSHTQQDSCSRYMYEDALNCNTVYIQQYLFSSLLYSKCFV